jgi:hypothetical protein
MSFQKIVLIIAIVILIILLVMFGIALNNKKNDETYPPVQSQCPDYWDVGKNDDGDTICKNTKKLGHKNCQTTMDFFKSPYVGFHGKCNKKKWAKTCGITWDGITNATGLC